MPNARVPSSETFNRKPRTQVPGRLGPPYIIWAIQVRKNVKYKWNFIDEDTQRHETVRFHGILKTSIERIK